MKCIFRDQGGKVDICGLGHSYVMVLKIMIELHNIFIISV